MNCPKFLRNTSVIALILAMLPRVNWAADGSSAPMDKTPIDRHALVTRHNVVLTNADRVFTAVGICLATRDCCMPRP